MQCKIFFLLSVHLTKIIFANLFYCLAYFCYYLWVLLHFLVLFMGFTLLFQLLFIFIYSTFSKKFSISVKSADSKRILKGIKIQVYGTFIAQSS